MNSQCAICDEIRRCEETLNRDAEGIAKMVIDFCHPVRERNNKRWQRFAWCCRLWFVGGIIFKIWNRPPGLEDAPEYHNEYWYKGCARRIEAIATQFENVKRKHLEHWGSEIVHVFNGEQDPPLPMTRSEAVAMGRGWLIPDEWDFHSAAGAEKLRGDILVMDANTKRILPENQCDWRNGQDGIFYYFRGSMPA